MLLFGVFSVHYGVFSCSNSNYPLYALKGSAGHLKFSFHLWVDTQLLTYVHLISKWDQKSPFYLWFVIWTDCAIRAVTPCSFIHVINVSEEVTALAYFKCRLVIFAHICSVYAVGCRTVNLLTEVSVSNFVRYTAFDWSDWNKAFRINLPSTPMTEAGIPPTRLQTRNHTASHTTSPQSWASPRRERWSWGGVLVALLTTAFMV